MSMGPNEREQHLDNPRVTRYITDLTAAHKPDVEWHSCRRLFQNGAGYESRVCRRCVSNFIPRLRKARVWPVMAGTSGTLSAVDTP